MFGFELRICFCAIAPSEWLEITWKLSIYLWNNSFCHVPSHRRRALSQHYCKMTDMWKRLAELLEFIDLFIAFLRGLLSWSPSRMHYNSILDFIYTLHAIREQITISCSIFDYDVLPPNISLNNKWTVCEQWANIHKTSHIHIEQYLKVQLAVMDYLIKEPCEPFTPLIFRMKRMNSTGVPIGPSFTYNEVLNLWPLAYYAHHGWAICFLAWCHEIQSASVKLRNKFWRDLAKYSPKGFFADGKSGTTRSLCGVSDIGQWLKPIHNGFLQGDQSCFIKNSIFFRLPCFGRALFFFFSLSFLLSSVLLPFFCPGLFYGMNYCASPEFTKWKKEYFLHLLWDENEKTATTEASTMDWLVVIISAKCKHSIFSNLSRECE